MVVINNELEKNEQTGHKSVLVTEVLEYLHIQPKQHYLDVTFGAGGHTKAILEKDPSVSVTALDWDAHSIDAYGPLLKEHYGNRISLVWGNFAQLLHIFKKNKIAPVDGILADFGTSQMQIFDRAGFSVRKDTELDMRMSPAHQQITAAQVVNTSSEEKLTQIFFQLGEERHARIIARAIVERRQQKKFRTTLDLATVVTRAIPGKKLMRIHPATKVFQALRMYVNHELDNINSFLIAAMRVIKPGGRLVCISFHSLEDRLVKNFFRQMEEKGLATVLTKKVVTASPEEVLRNPSSRSAKLRAIEITRESPII